MLKKEKIKELWVKEEDHVKYKDLLFNRARRILIERYEDYNKDTLYVYNDTGDLIALICLKSVFEISQKNRGNYMVYDIEAKEEFD